MQASRRGALSIYGSRGTDSCFKTISLAQPAAKLNAALVEDRSGKRRRGTFSNICAKKRPRVRSALRNEMATEGRQGWQALTP